MKRGKGRPVLLVVLLLVNAAAVWGQAGWALDHIVPAGWAQNGLAALALSLGFALAIETIGVFLALSADHAEDRDIPAGGIRLGSYAIGLVSGALNASHWGWTTAAAIAFALLSAISPFLWGIHSRVNRERVIAPSRRFWHPRRSVALIRHMAWEGIATEAEGIASMKEQTDVSTAPALVARLVPGQSGSQPAPVRQSDARSVLVHGRSERQAALEGRAAAEGAPVAPRAPRAPKEAQEKAVRLMLDGLGAVAVADGLVGASTMRRFQQVAKALRADPTTDDFGSATGRVPAALVAIIRNHVTEERAA